MAGKKRLGFRPIDRFEGAKAAADWAMAARGYQPCLGNYILDIGRKQEHPCTRQGGTNHGEVRHG